jgi:hypothetical protein
LVITKGATNKNTKKETVVKPIDPNAPVKTRGIQKGQKIERDPVIIVQLNDKFRVKIDKLNKTLQEKSEKKKDINTETEDDDNEDAGWRNLGHWQSWEHIFKQLVDELTKRKLLKAQKEHLVYFEQCLELFNKSTKEAKKMFANIDEVQMK